MATTAVSSDFINIVATEMSCGVERAVAYWLAQIDQIVMNADIAPSLKLSAISAVLEHYERLTGKQLLQFACTQ